MYRTLNSYLREKFGCKVYKLALSGGMTCPNRDGTKGTRGCIFCSGLGSGEFAAHGKSIAEQLEDARKRVKAKVGEGCKYIAYFQDFSNTYAPVEYLKGIYREAISPSDVVALSVATRPDCLPDDVLCLLSEINSEKPVWVELGLQTIHEKSAEYIRTGYTLDAFDSAVTALKGRGIEVVVHMIVGLPGETSQQMLETAKYISDSGADGIKLHLLHVLRGTDLAIEYEKGNVPVLSLDEYASIVKGCLDVMRDDIVIHRLTGDGAKRDLIAPLWSADKKKVLAELGRVIK